MKVRRAILTDITSIVLFGGEHQHLLSEDDPPFSPSYFRRQLKRSLRDRDTEIFLAFNAEGAMCGVLWAWIAGYCWSPDQYVTDILFLADQGGDRLLNAMYRWAQSRNVTRAVVQTHMEFEGERVRNFYLRKGFREVGGVFEKRL